MHLTMKAFFISRDLQNSSPVSFCKNHARQQKSTVYLQSTNLLLVDNNRFFSFFLEFCYNGCTGFRNGNFEPLAKLKCLERLEFYDSNSFVREWMAIIRNNVKLRHLNLGKSSRSLGRSSPDEIDESYISLETLNYELENMDLVVKCLSHCENLRELNIAYW